MDLIACREEQSLLPLSGTEPRAFSSQSVTIPTEPAQPHCFNIRYSQTLRNCSPGVQIRRPRFDSWHYQKKKIVGLERGPLSFVSTTEELLDRKVAAPV
jgi:hypothetical protein